MVEYAILLAHNTTNIFGMTGRDVLAWVEGLNWSMIAIGALGLISLRMTIRAFSRR
jgi:hypothetical protein